MDPENRRYRRVADYFEDKSVLHIGCVGDERATELGANSIHRKIQKDASRLVGIDLNKEGVEKMQDAGYSVHLADAQSFSLGERFDIVFAGDIIEHLTNFDGFLKSVKEHLEPDGRLILTTPNSQALYQFAYYAMNNEATNDFHTCWFDHPTLSHLLSRYSFRCEDIQFVPITPRPNNVRQLLAWASETVLPPRLGHRSLVIVAAQDIDNFK